VENPPLLPRPCPEGGGRFVRLVSPKVGSPVSGLCYSSAVVGTNTHFLHGRTHPCLGTGPECIGHAEGIPVRWKGYLFGLSDQTHQPVLFEIPADCVRQTIQLRDSAVNLRGAMVRFIRIGPNINSPVRAEVRLDARPQACPEEEPDIIRWLSVIWGIEDPRDTILRTEGGHDA
jgi:hypothetical protein